MSDAAARPSITTTAGAIILAALLASCAGTAYRDDDHPPARIVDRSAVTAIDPGSKLSAGWQHGAFIEIFVRAWRDSDGDGLGDLRGVTQSLDYLRDLHQGYLVNADYAKRRSRPWVRGHGFPNAGTRLRHAGGFRRTGSRGARTRNRRDHGLRHQSQCDESSAVRRGRITHQP